MPPRSSKSKRGRQQASSDEYDPVVQESVDFILSSIRDPNNVRHCGRCLLGAFLPLSSSVKVLNGEMDALPKLTKNDIFWEHIYNFLILKRSEEQIGLLLTRFSECNCSFQDKNVKRYHDDGLRFEPSVMNRTYMEYFAADSKKPLLTAGRCAAVVEMFFLLHGYLSKCRIISVGKGNAVKWPHTAIDLVAYGPEITIGSLFQWYSYIPDPSIFSIIGAITRLSQTIIIPGVLQFNVSQLVAESTRMVVDVTLENIRRLGTTIRNGAVTDSLRSVTSTRFIFQAKCVFEYLSGLNALPIDVCCSLLRGSETKLMQLCTIMVYLFSDPRCRTVFHDLRRYSQFFSEYSQWLFRFFHMHLYPRPDMPVHPHVLSHDIMTFPPPASCRSTEETAIHYIVDSRIERRCSAHMCPNSLQSVGRAFQRCARCNIVSYCGRECQVKAWRDEKYPHKRICPIMRTLVDAGGGPTMFFPVHNQAPTIPITEFMPKTFEDVRPNKFFILQNWRNANVSEEDLKYLSVWGKWHDATCYMPNGSEWHPGFEDYNALIEELTQPIGPGPKAVYLNRLVRWPSEVAKEKEHLEVQAFWNEDIEC